MTFFNKKSQEIENENRLLKEATEREATIRKASKFLEGQRSRIPCTELIDLDNDIKQVIECFNRLLTFANVVDHIEFDENCFDEMLADREDKEFFTAEKEFFKEEIFRTVMDFKLKSSD